MDCETVSIRVNGLDSDRLPSMSRSRTDLYPPLRRTLILLVPLLLLLVVFIPLRDYIPC